MGKGKRRNTGKTGDKALYKKAAEAREKNVAFRQKRENDGDDDDNMYDDVDKYHNRLDKDFMKFDDGGGGKSTASDDEEEVEAVMDLGVGGGSSDEEEEEDDSDDDESEARTKRRGRQPTAKEEMSSSDDDDDEDDDQEIEDVRDWGKKKASYYHGDTADLELGQNEEDAFLEEQAVKEIQEARLKEMDEGDFMPSDDDDQDDDENQTFKPKTASTTKKVSTLRDISKLSSKDRRKLLEMQHPGLLQITSHFAETVRNLKDRTNVATKALFEGGDEATAEAVGATKLGQKFLLTKALIESSTALNLAMFLLLKSEESSSSSSNDDLTGSASSSTVQFHPVMKRLQEFNVLGQKLKGKVQDRVEGLEEQMDSLMKAAELMKSMADEEEDDADEKKEDDKDSGEDSGKHDHNMTNTDQADSEDLKTSSEKSPAMASASSSDDESSVDEEAIARSTIHNARFGLRPNEMAQDRAANNSRRKRRRGAPSDLGDDADAEIDKKGASRYLSSAINSIEQRAASKKKKKEKQMGSSEQLVEQREADDELRRGLDMMEAELGKFSSDEEEGNGEALADDDIDSDGDDGFYASMTKKSKRKKAMKKSLYQVAPKYPNLEGEVDGERAISRAIMKNRGLVPHKNKLNRNPRVKKREQYRKALIRRKGAVREVRTDEGHRYGGEETGIKRGISRSRKLGTN